MSVRSPEIIGALWPRCNKCKHIAQAHDSNGCSEIDIAQCPTCHRQASKIKCVCKEYVGPTLKEFMDKFMTPEEIAYFSKKWNVIHERS